MTSKRRFRKKKDRSDRKGRSIRGELPIRCIVRDVQDNKETKHGVQWVKYRQNSDTEKVPNQNS